MKTRKNGFKEILNYKGYKEMHIKETQGFCGAGYYIDTLCGTRIITASGCMGFGVVWSIQKEAKRKPMCKKCNFLANKQ